MIEDASIKNFLDSIGFTSSEIEIYLNLLGSGPLNIGEISRVTKIPRTTVSRNIKKLTKKGIVSKLVKMHETLIEAEDPNKLELILREKEIKLENKLSSVHKKQKDFKKILQILSNVHHQKPAINNVTIKYYEGLKGVKNAYKLITDSSADRIYTFLNADKYFDIFPETHDLFKDYLNENKKSKVHEILVGNIVSKQLKQAISDIGSRCICKFGKSNFVFKDFDFLIYNKSVVMIDINKSTPSAILIESETITDGLKGMHQMLWQFLPKVSDV